MKIFTIGFTQKGARTFFESIKENKIDLLIDIRLNNTSQLAGFAKFPDIEFFLNEISNCKYVHDSNLAPCESTLKKYKNKEIKWAEYCDEFTETMSERKIIDHIKSQYSNVHSVCLLCSESTHEMCHRSIVAKYFQEAFNGSEVIHI